MATETGKDRETLEAFQGRFGDLSDRMKAATHPDLQTEEMSRAELPGRTDEIGEDHQENVSDEFLPGVSVQQSFEDVAGKDNDGASEGLEKSGGDQSDGSQMIKEEAASHTLPPPENSQDVDREIHQTRMAQDDAQSRRGYSDEYIAELNADVREAGYGRGQGHDQYQANDGQTYDP